ncbi:2TM domain-containing protein [Collimonas sp. OK307]|uniref:2TM domain-containing protein n=1 Tax=Collimonas sp. OK307 TaxID=1801620 RepID=UPI0008F25834|nr:2TM domain-containing protein [Collimonas sp. OK307]SFH79023.1 2TM domain-containing protein [Collimonas sp. OK307]
MRDVTPNTNPHYQDAQRQVERKIGFYLDLAAYVIVNSGLVLLNFLHNPCRPWVLGPILGWGIGLLFHALAVFLKNPGAQWKRRMIERELEKNNHIPPA